MEITLEIKENRRDELLEMLLKRFPPGGVYTSEYRFLNMIFNLEKGKLEMAVTHLDVDRDLMEFADSFTVNGTIKLKENIKKVWVEVREELKGKNYLNRIYFIAEDIYRLSYETWSPELAIYGTFKAEAYPELKRIIDELAKEIVTLAISHSLGE